jgi:hypothetical protein
MLPLSIAFVLYATNALAIGSLLHRRVSSVPIRAQSFKAVAFTNPSPDLVTSNVLKLTKQYTDGKRGVDKCPLGLAPATQEIRYGFASSKDDVRYRKLIVIKTILWNRIPDRHPSQWADSYCHRGHRVE